MNNIKTIADIEENLKYELQSIQDREAEQAIMGAFIYDNESLNEVFDILDPKYFSPEEFKNNIKTPDHQSIYKAIQSLKKQDSAIDEILIGDQLKKYNKLEKAGGYAYLAELLDCVPSSGNVIRYTNIVLEKALLRAEVVKGELIKRVAKGDDHLSGILDDHEECIKELKGRKDQKNDCSHIGNVAVDLADIWATRSENFEKGITLTGLNTGLIDLNKITHGLQKTDLIVLAGRPSMGKTALALNIAKNAADSMDSEKDGVLVFSLEMQKEQLCERIVCSTAKVDSSKLKTGALDEQDDWDNLSKAVNDFADVPIYFNDDSKLNPDKIEAIAKRLDKNLENGVSLIVIDYLQLMSGTNPKAPREQQISEISRRLKLLAKELKVPVIALSQLNRELEKRSDKRPIMADLRESGAIEQDADIIMFVYRDEVYHSDTPDKGVAELILGKHRNGALGTVKLSFTGKYTLFDNLCNWES